MNGRECNFFYTHDHTEIVLDLARVCVIYNHKWHESPYGSLATSKKHSITMP